MLDDERATQPLVGVQLLSYTLGELDEDARESLEKKIANNPNIKEELEEIRRHLRLHSDVRKVAPRRGSYERLRQRMKKEGAFDGAIPGIHCMLRRSFMIAMLIGAIAIGLLIAFSKPSGTVAAPDVIGQIVFHNPSLEVGQRRAEVERRELLAKGPGDDLENTGAYDAFIWLPTGVSNTYSTIEVAQNTEFKFTGPRKLEITRGFLRRLEIEPGGIGEGPFVIATPHGEVLVDKGSLSINLTRDGAETQVQVGHGSAQVRGKDSDRAFTIPAGSCTEIERGKLPNPPRSVLSLALDRPGASRYVLRATLRNQGFVPVKVRRAVDSEKAVDRPVYVMHASFTSEYDPASGLNENGTLPPMAVTPEAELSVDHAGEMWLEPGGFYRFRFDISNLLFGTQPVEHWLRLVYQGDLYGPPGEAKVKIVSPNLKLDLRE